MPIHQVESKGVPSQKSKNQYDVVKEPRLCSDLWSSLRSAAYKMGDLAWIVLFFEPPFIYR